MKLYFVGICAVALSACEYVAPMCNQSHLADVAGGLEGKYEMVMTDTNTDVVRDQIEFHRVGTGVYHVTTKDGGGNLPVCEANGRTFIESHEKDGNLMALFVSADPVGFSFMVSTFDKADLTAAGIPFEVVESKSFSFGSDLFSISESLASRFSMNQATKTLVAHNEKMADPTALRTHLVATSAVIRYFKKN